LALNYQKIQSSDCHTQLSMAGIVVKSTPLGVRIISSFTKSCQSINQNDLSQLHQSSDSVFSPKQCYSLATSTHL